MSIATDNALLYREFRGAMNDWFTERLKIRSVRMGSVYTDTQKLKIKDYQIEPVGINICKKITNTIAANIFSNRNSKGVIPLGMTSKQIAFLLRAMFVAYEQKIKWRTHWWSILKDAYGEGIGVARVERANNIFGCRTRYVPYTNLVWRGSADDMFWEDLEYLVYFEPMTVKEAIQRYKKQIGTSEAAVKEILEFDTNYSGAFGEKQDVSIPDEAKTVYLLESYCNESRDYERIYLMDSTGSSYEAIDIEGKAKDDDRYSNAYDYLFRKTNKDENYSRTMIQRMQEYEKLPEPMERLRCVQHSSIGGKDIGSFVLPCKRHNHVPLIYELNHYPNSPLTDIMEIQNAINQSILLLMHNGRMLSTPKVFAIEGTINEKKYATQMSQPFGIVTIKPKDLSNLKESMPMVQMVQPIGNDFPALIMMLKNLAEDLSGIYASFQGNPAGSPETFRTLTSLNQQASQLMVPLAVNAQHMLEHLGTVEKDFWAEYSDDDAVISFQEHNDEMLAQFTPEDMKSMDPAKHIGVRVKGMPDYNVQLPINYKQTTGNRETRMLNSVRDPLIDTEISMSTMPATDSFRREVAAVLQELGRQGGPEWVDAIAKDVMKLMDIPLSQEIASRADRLRQMGGELQQLQEANKKLEALYLDAEGRAATAREAEAQAESSRQFAARLETIKNRVLLSAEKIDLLIKSGEKENQLAAQAQTQELVSELKELLAVTHGDMQDKAENSPFPSNTDQGEQS